MPQGRTVGGKRGPRGVFYKETRRKAVAVVNAAMESGAALTNVEDREGFGGGG